MRAEILRSENNEHGRGSLFLSQATAIFSVTVAMPLQIIPPGKNEIAAFRSDRIESEKRIGGNGGMQFRAENCAAVVGTVEGLDDVPRNGLSGIAEPESGFHRMLDQRADLDNLAALCACRHARPGRAHAAHSPHSEVTTSISAAADQRESSLSTATARSCCVVATLTRDDTTALPL